MDTDRLNRWLNLVAIIGVIVGIAFLIVELDQANRFARYTAENARRSQFIEINSSRIEFSEVYAKLQAGDTELTPSERAQAVNMARQLLNTWLDAESAYNYGLLSEATFESTLIDISAAFKEAPGLIPFMAYLIDLYEMEDDPSIVTKRLVEVVGSVEY